MTGREIELVHVDMDKVHRRMTPATTVGEKVLIMLDVAMPGYVYMGEDIPPVRYPNLTEEELEALRPGFEAAFRRVRQQRLGMVE